MENKGRSWKGMTYEELEEFQDKLYKIWKRAHPEPAGEDRDRLEEMQARAYLMWARDNPEAAEERQKMWEECPPTPGLDCPGAYACGDEPVVDEILYGITYNTQD